jgi:RNA polymerase sigma factor (sigma-70 family)
VRIAETATVGHFGVTAWSTVLEARASEDEVRQSALERLFQRYRKPIVQEIQFRQRCHEHTAEDLAHDFIAVCLHRDFLKNIDPQQGRFRSFIHKCLSNFLKDQHTRHFAKKRGGGAVPVSLDEQNDEGDAVLEPPTDGPLPDEILDRGWANQIVEEALERLEQECAAVRRATLFQALRSQLGRETPDSSLASVAARLAMNEGAVKVALHRLRQRLGELVADEIKQTVANQGEWREELRYLLDLIGRQPRC